MAAAPFSLSWDAPQGCPQRDTILSEVAELLKPMAPSGSFGAVIHTPEPGRWTLHLHSETGERDLSATSCDAVAHAAAVVIALAIRPDGGDADPSRSTSPPPGPETSRSSKPDVSDPVRWTLSMGAGARIDTGMLARTGLGLAGGMRAGVRNSRFGFEGEVMGAYFGDQTTSVGGSPVGGRFSLRTLHVQLNPFLVEGRWALGPTFGVSLDRMSGEAFGVPIAQAQGTWIPALDAGGTVESRLSKKLALHWTLLVHVPTRRPEFIIAGVGSIHRVGAASVQSGISVSFALF